MQERLQKILSARGLASRRASEEMIQQGRVVVNGAVARLGDSADPDTDQILVDGKPIPEKRDYVYIMLHKPRGFVTTLSDEQGRRTAAELVADCAVRVYPVGRLDMDSEGLLLFTNDGAFANMLMHPKHEVDKTYLAWVNHFTQTNYENLKMPITLDGYTIRPPKLRLLKAAGNQGLIEITIHEGRNRQVRRMCEQAGMHVTRLRRIREGHLALGELPSGKWRYLTEQELDILRKSEKKL